MKVRHLFLKFSLLLFLFFVLPGAAVAIANNMKNQAWFEGIGIL